MQIGKCFTVIHEPESNTVSNRHPIILARGRAFGSGGHETTRSCLEQLEKIDFTKHSRVLDVGCGSGILSIAASRLGAETVIALDPNPNAISTARTNIYLNRVESSIFLFRGELSALKIKNYSLIMANLYGDIILNIFSDLARLLAHGATLLLSGILYEYAYDIKKKGVAHNCQFVKAFYLEEYITMLFKKSLIS